MAQEPKRALHLLSHQEDCLWNGVGRYVQPRVDRRKHGRMVEPSYNPILPRKVENCRAPARGGHRIHWREGGSRRTNLLKGDITRLRARTIMSTDIDRIAELAKDDSKRQFSSIAHLITVEKAGSISPKRTGNRGRSRFRLLRISWCRRRWLTC